MPVRVLSYFCFGLQAALAARRCSETVHLRWCPVVEYGVLGTAQSADGGKIDQVGETPDNKTAILDPGDLQSIQTHGPSRAGRASAAIYKWIGIGKDASFAADVKESITEPLKAKYYKYESDDGNKHVIHAVGPSFVRGTYKLSEVLASLATVYKNILMEFVNSGLPKLRVLPISSGAFSGDMADKMPTLTAEALLGGYLQLDVEYREYIRSKKVNISMCIFDQSLLEKYRDAFDDVDDERVTKAIAMHSASRPVRSSMSNLLILTLFLLLKI
eukprot:TRINITY_DN27557_c0_g1_i1.p1 TRINITY_DN27557_c0_g1~~TRINITY_DN27557_c0_g1_i1.p1  ORF type:complete len:273 (+),score=34.90 TRINITY_DN27557_c0_g1_i1:87-905(+)